jgi:aspartyl-tRNA(Asn)/glutamyl-tRNA(Gln) amidotransferase subunit C
MVLQKADLVNVAKLARLSLKEEEIPRLIDDLDRIIAFVAQLKEVDVTDVEPMSHAKDAKLSFRPDVAEKVLGRECFANSVGFDLTYLRGNDYLWS